MVTTRLQDAYILRSRIISKQSPSLLRSSGKPRGAGRRNKIVSPEINLVSKLVSSTCKGRRSRRNHAATPWRSITASFKRCEEDNLGQGQDSTKSSSLKASPRTTCGCCPTRDIDEEEEGYREQCTDCAQTALEHIHKRLGMAAYELVDIGDSSAFKGRRFENCFYIHSNFKAKPQGSHPSQTILFFAKLKLIPALMVAFLAIQPTLSTTQLIRISSMFAQSRCRSLAVDPSGLVSLQ